MSTTECAASVPLPGSSAADQPDDDAHLDFPHDAPNRASKLLRGLLISFAATVTLGLALTTWYVATRMVAESSRNYRTSPPPDIHTAQNSAEPTPAPPLSAAEASIAESYWYTVPRGDVYLQVAGLGPKQDADFAQSLEAQGFRAQMQMRDGAVTRVLIGPFSTRAEMEKEKRKLLLAGVLAVETAY